MSLELGRRGEDAATELYPCIIERNVRSRHGEIDFIAREEDGTICFVEVKTRSGRSYGGAEAVDHRKLSRMRRVAAEWLRTHPAATIRFDVVEMIANGMDWDLTQFRGVEHGAC